MPLMRYNYVKKHLMQKKPALVAASLFILMSKFTSPKLIFFVTAPS